MKTKIIIGMKFKFSPSKANAKNPINEEFFKHKNNIMENDIILVKTVDGNNIGISVNGGRMVHSISKHEFEKMIDNKMVYNI